MTKYNLSISWPIPEYFITLFISFCYEANCSLSTVRTYIAGISYFHRLRGFDNLSSKFVVAKLLEGYARCRPQVPDVRRPINKTILRGVIEALPSICYNTYEVSLFRAIFTLAYFGLFRISELVTIRGIPAGNHLLKENIKLAAEGGNVSVTLVRTKATPKGPPLTIKLGSELTPPCPVRTLSVYMSLRPTIKSRVAFVHQNGDPATRQQVTTILHKCLLKLGYNTACFQSHSFRIGRATDLSIGGLAPESIARLGRWSSDSYKRYLRI